MGFHRRPDRRVHAENSPQAGENNPASLSNCPQAYQKLLDDSTPYVKARWALCLFTVAAFFTRILIVQVGRRLKRILETNKTFKFKFSKKFLHNYVANSSYLSSFSGLVHRDVRLGDLPPEPPSGVPDP